MNKEEIRQQLLEMYEEAIWECYLWEQEYYYNDSYNNEMREKERVKAQDKVNNFKVLLWGI